MTAASLAVAPIVGSPRSPAEGLVQSQGGILLEQLKAQHLHLDAQILDALVVDVDDWMPLFVVL
ncbi:MAG: hypothetical protein ACYCX7_08825, partial [Solirubrobacteraceae bacterium]